MLTVREASIRSGQIKQERNPETARAKTEALYREVLITIGGGHKSPRMLACAALVERE